MMPAPTEYSEAREISPSSTIEALAVVPPMSKVMIFGRSLARASACAPTTQQAGGDAGLVEAAAQRAQVARDDRHDIGVDHRRRGALVFLDLGQHLVGDAVFEIGRLARHDLLD